MILFCLPQHAFLLTDSDFHPVKKKINSNEVDETGAYYTK